MAIFAKYPVTGGSGGVTTLNGLSGALTLAAGSNITLTPSGNTITIASSGGGGGITALTGDVTATGPGSVPASLTAVTNSTLTTLSALSLPASQVTGLAFANQSLSNLTSPTAINQFLTFGTSSLIGQVRGGTAVTGNGNQLIISGGSASGTNLAAGNLTLQTGESTGTNATLNSISLKLNKNSASSGSTLILPYPAAVLSQLQPGGLGTSQYPSLSLLSSGSDTGINIATTSAGPALQTAGNVNNSTLLFQTRGDQATNTFAMVTVYETSNTLQIYDANSTNSVGLTVPSLASSYTLTLPNAQGDTGTVLTNNGAGGLSWQSILLDGTNTQQVAWSNTGIVIGQPGATSQTHVLNTQLATGAGTSTLGTANSPGASTPAGWIQITINGNIQYIPFF